MKALIYQFLLFGLSCHCHLNALSFLLYTYSFLLCRFLFILSLFPNIWHVKLIASLLWSHQISFLFFSYFQMFHFLFQYNPSCHSISRVLFLALWSDFFLYSFISILCSHHFACFLIVFNSHCALFFFCPVLIVLHSNCVLFSACFIPFVFCSHCVYSYCALFLYHFRFSRFHFFQFNRLY